MTVDLPPVSFRPDPLGGTLYTVSSVLGTGLLAAVVRDTPESEPILRHLGVKGVDILSYSWAFPTYSQFLYAYFTEVSLRTVERGLPDDTPGTAGPESHSRSPLFSRGLTEGSGLRRRRNSGRRTGNRNHTEARPPLFAA